MEQYYCRSCGALAYPYEHECNPSLEDKVDNILCLLIDIEERIRKVEGQQDEKKKTKV